jgi:hypothetical protein
MVKELELLADKLYFIPGNHDPITLFNQDFTKRPRVSTDADSNVHLNAIQLREDLILIGLGGCV